MDPRLLELCRLSRENIRKGIFSFDDDIFIILNNRPDEKESAACGKLLILVLEKIRKAAGTMKNGNFPNLVLVQEKREIPPDARDYVIWNNPVLGKKLGIKPEIIAKTFENSASSFNPFMQNCGKLTNLYGPRQDLFDFNPDGHEVNHYYIEESILALHRKGVPRFSDFQNLIRAVVFSQYCERCLYAILSPLKQVDDVWKLIDLLRKGVWSPRKMKDMEICPNWLDDSGKKYGVNCWRMNPHAQLKCGQNQGLAEISHSETWTDPNSPSTSRFSMSANNSLLPSSSRASVDSTYGSEHQKERSASKGNPVFSPGSSDEEERREKNTQLTREKKYKSFRQMVTEKKKNNARATTQNGRKAFEEKFSTGNKSLLPSSSRFSDHSCDGSELEEEWSAPKRTSLFPESSDEEKEDEKTLKTREKKQKNAQHKQKNSTIENSKKTSEDKSPSKEEMLEAFDAAETHLELCETELPIRRTSPSQHHFCIFCISFVEFQCEGDSHKSAEHLVNQTMQSCFRNVQVLDERSFEKIKLEFEQKKCAWKEGKLHVAKTSSTAPDISRMARRTGKVLKSKKKRNHSISTSDETTSSEKSGPSSKRPRGGEAYAACTTGRIRKQVEQYTVGTSETDKLLEKEKKEKKNESAEQSDDEPFWGPEDSAKMRNAWTMKYVAFSDVRFEQKDFLKSTVPSSHYRGMSRRQCHDLLFGKSYEKLQSSQPEFLQSTKPTLIRMTPFDDSDDTSEDGNEEKDEEELEDRPQLSGITEQNMDLTREVKKTDNALAKTNHENQLNAIEVITLDDDDEEVTPSRETENVQPNNKHCQS